MKNQSLSKHRLGRTFILLSPLIITIMSFGAKAVSDFEPCYQDLCGNETYTMLNGKAIKALAENQKVAIENRFGKQIKYIIEKLPPEHKDEKNDPKSYDKNYARCIGIISTAIAHLPTQNQIASFMEHNPINLYIAGLTDWLGSDAEKALKSTLINNTHLYYPISQENLLSAIDMRLNSVLADPNSEWTEKFSGPYLCTATNDQLFASEPFDGMWDAFATDGFVAPKDGAQTFGTEYFGKIWSIGAKLAISPYTIKSKDYFVFYHELSHIVNYMEKRSFIPDKAAQRIRKARACSYRNYISVHQTQPRNLNDRQIYNATSESFPDELASFIYKQQYRSGTPRLFCEALSTFKSQTGSLSINSGKETTSPEHISPVLRTLLVHSEINGQMPTTCRQFLKDQDQNFEVEDCFTNTF